MERGLFMAITNLGKELRKLRLDLGITLFDMASRAGVSSSLLSSVETGKKPASSALMGRLADAFEPIAEQRAKFDRLATETQSEVRIRLGSNEAPKANELALAFARKFDDLSTQDIDELLGVFVKKAGQK